MWFFICFFLATKIFIKSRPLCACLWRYVRGLKLYLHTDCTVFISVNKETLLICTVSVLRIRIRDPGLGAFLTSGSGIRDGRKSASGSGIRDEQPGSYFLELKTIFLLFLGLYYLNSLMRIRDPGSGINIPDPPHCTVYWRQDQYKDQNVIFYMLPSCNKDVYESRPLCACLRL